MSPQNPSRGVRIHARDHKAIATMLAGQGWHPDPDAAAAICDWRGGDERGGVAGAVVLVDRGDGAALAAADAGGAAMFLVDPVDAVALSAALAFAERAAARQGRRRAEEEGSAALQRRIAQDTPLAVALVALTRFEIVNAAFGRTAGDALLDAAEARIADAVHAQLGASAGVERRSGAAFLVFAPVDGDAMARAAEAIDATLAGPFAQGGASVNLGSRIGVATRVGDDDDARLIRRATDALAAAKASDSATTQRADTPGVAAPERLAADLHRAIERGEIAILFQPQVAIASGAIAGVEALARWDHPEFGSLGAGALFAAADRADLGLALSDHIQALALERAAAWPASLDALRLAVNVTAADIARAGFAERFLARVEASGFARARVTVEVTESGLIEDLGSAADLLTRLRGAGLRIAIDDFGTGYSSLAYLKALPLDYLKIDRAMAQDIAGSARDQVIVRGVIAMARSLGLETIAEGVETEDQRARLAAEGCTYFQGFLCAEPLDETQLRALVERG